MLCAYLCAIIQIFPQQKRCIKKKELPHSPENAAVPSSYNNKREILICKNGQKRIGS